jgi:hypothetical protein
MGFATRELMASETMIQRVIVFNRPVEPGQGFNTVTRLANDKTKARAVTIDGPFALRKIWYSYH